MSIYYNVYHTHTQSFDREEFEMEILRRSSSSICTSGLFSLNADQGVVNVSVDSDAGYTCELFGGPPLCIDNWIMVILVCPNGL